LSAAWHGSALKVYSPGANLLPTVHAADLAAYVAALLSCCAGPSASAAPAPGPASQSLGCTAATTTRMWQQQAAAEGAHEGPSQQYLLVADARAVGQRELVEAVSSALGSGRVEEVPLCELLLEGQLVGALRCMFGRAAK
jgi:hypothetical protein